MEVVNLIIDSPMNLLFQNLISSHCMLIGNNWDVECPTNVSYLESIIYFPEPYLNQMMKDTIAKCVTTYKSDMIYNLGMVLVRILCKKEDFYKCQQLIINLAEKKIITNVSNITNYIDVISDKYNNHREALSVIKQIINLNIFK